MTLVWVSASFGSYLISGLLKFVEGDFYIGQLTSTVSESTAYALSGIIFKFAGIKKTILISFIIAIASMICLAFIDP